MRTGFLDRPQGYKGHALPTPYLGGAALAGGVVAATMASGAASNNGVLLGCALLLWALGTLDDRRNLSPVTRVVAEAGVGLVLWGTGHGWDVLGSAPADAALTVLWIVGIVNAFNLMDNMNGAAATCAAVSAAGAAGLALLGGHVALAALCATIAGASVGFLPHNLARPSAIFMGDGGSMLLGALVAGIVMSAASAGNANALALVPGGLVVGLAIFDTTLVSISRRRGGRPLLSGGRDHLTHRLALRLGSTRRVPVALAVGQAVLCTAALGAVYGGTIWIITSGSAAVCIAVAAGIYLEDVALFSRPRPPARPEHERLAIRPRHREYSSSSGAPVRSDQSLPPPESPRLTEA